MRRRGATRERVNKMSIRRGLQRVWVVAAIIYMLIAGVVCAQHIYQMHKQEAAARAEVAAAGDQANEPSNAPGWYGESPQHRLEKLEEELFLSKTLGPAAVVLPPLAVYLLGAALIWALSGFKNDATAREGSADNGMSRHN